MCRGAGIVTRGLTVVPAEFRREVLDLIEVLKDEHAMTLMESLPPVNWDRLATKEDLAAAITPI